jgi:hypothetical protein
MKPIRLNSDGTLYRHYYEIREVKKTDGAPSYIESLVENRINYLFVQKKSVSEDTELAKTSAALVNAQNAKKIYEDRKTEVWRIIDINTPGPN